MRERLAIICGQTAYFFICLCGLLDPDVAVDFICLMHEDMEKAAKEVEIEEQQERFNKAMKDKIRTPGR